MIQVTIQKGPGPDDYRGFEMSGHANSDQRGKDLVCCAASTLGIGTVNLLGELLGLPIKRKLADGYLFVHLPENLDAEALTLARFAIQGFQYNMRELAKSYPNYISIQIRKE